MSTPTFLSVLGIGVSLLFGAWGVYLAVVRRYQGEITFVLEQTIGLFDSIVKNLPEIAVLYKAAPVSPNVVLVRGALLNTGTKDISPSMIERPITLGLPVGSNWLSATVIEASQDVKARVQLSDPNAITFDTGLFRRNEFIRFQALAQLGNGVQTVEEAVLGHLEDRLKRSIFFDHRIQDTNTIKTLELRAPRTFRRRLRRYLLFTITGTLLVVAMTLSASFLGLWNKLAYDVQLGNGEITRVTVVRLRADSISVRSLDGKYKSTMTIGRFFSLCRGNPLVVRDSKEAAWMIGSTLFFYVFVPCLLIGLQMKSYFREKKLGGLLGVDGAAPPRSQ